MAEVSPPRQVAAQVVHAAFEILRQNGGEMRGRDVVQEVEQRVELDDWVKERYEASGYIRWKTFLHFFTGDCVKAGFLLKKSGTWRLTPVGSVMTSKPMIR